MATRQKTKGEFLLYRSETDKVVGGVCGGIAEALDINSSLIRIIFLVTFLFGGTGILLYIILWIVIPSKSHMNKTANETISENLSEMKERAYEIKDQFHDRNRQNSRAFAGIIVVGLGVIFLLNNFGYGRYFVNLGRLWPLVLVAIGFLIISKKDH